MYARRIAGATVLPPLCAHRVFTADTNGAELAQYGRVARPVRE